MKFHRSISCADSVDCAPSVSLPSASGRRGGFALVVALGLRAFILLLLLSIATFVRVEQASVQAEIQQTKANQAALLSMQLAIGKLQATAGVDQRVTAPAESVAGSDGPMQLTGVWRSWEGSDHLPTGLPIIPDYDSKLVTGDPEVEVASFGEGRFLGWLVSPAYDPLSPNAYDATSPPSLDEVQGVTVPLVADGSVTPDSAVGETVADVEVHLQPTLMGDGDVAIAWWVSGENTKAFLKERDDPDTIDGWIQNQAASGRADPEEFGLVDDDLLGRAVTLDSMDIASADGSSVSKKYFHDMSTSAQGLLTNTATGGWRKDLSLMSEVWHQAYDDLGRPIGLPVSNLPVFSEKPYTASTTASLRLSDNATTAAIYPWVTQDRVSMSWHSLMDFVSLYKRVKINATSGEPYFDAVATNDSDWISMQPLLARAHFAFGYDAVAASGGTYTPRFLFKPSVTMWNPYNVAIESSITSLLHISDDAFPINLYAQVGDQPEAELDIGRLLGDRVSSARARLVINSSRSDDNTWKPGESRIFGVPGLTGEDNNGWNWYTMDAGFSIRGSKTLPVSRGSSVSNGAATDSFRYRWEYKNIVSPYLDFYWLRGGGSTPDGESLWGKICKYGMSTSTVTAPEKLPLPALTNDDETLASAAAEDSPFLAVSMGLRTLLNEDVSGALPKLHTKGYFNSKLIAPGVTILGGQTAEDSPYSWEIFAPNSWEDPFMPQSDDVVSFGRDHSSYVGTSFQAGVGLNRWAIAELPTQPLMSLGELQHFDVSFRNQYPPRVANAIGNSHASPNIAAESVNNTLISDFSYDHSYVSNHVLFDDWFVSSITPNSATDTRGINSVYESHVSGGEPLRNRAYRLVAGVTMDDFEFLSEADAWCEVASKLEVEGMFNINSTSVEAWSALLKHMRDASIARVEVGAGGAADDWQITLEEANGSPVSRTTVAGDPQSAVDPSLALVATHLEMSDVQVEALAAAIVDQIKLRGPFLSLSEFINRKLDSDEDLALAGAIESALIELSEMGAVAENPYSEIQAAFPEQAVLPSDAAAVYEFPNAAVGDAVYGMPGWPRQADILRPLAPIISARDDTFRIRAYGDARDTGGGVVARSWCEAVVRRKAEYVDSSTNVPTDSTNLSDMNKEFGRRFEVVSFRWLAADEI